MNQPLPPELARRLPPDPLYIACLVAMAAIAVIMAGPTAQIVAKFFAVIAAAV